MACPLPLTETTKVNKQAAEMHIALLRKKSDMQRVIDPTLPIRVQ